MIRKGAGRMPGFPTLQREAVDRIVEFLVTGDEARPKGASIHDRTFRAFDKATGKLLWSAPLPFSGNATPATYEAAGRQIVVIAAGGGKSPSGGSGGVYIAFALPQR